MAVPQMIHQCLMMLVCFCTNLIRSELFSATLLKWFYKMSNYSYLVISKCLLEKGITHSKRNSDLIVLVHMKAFSLFIGKSTRLGMVPSKNRLARVRHWKIRIEKRRD